MRLPMRSASAVLARAALLLPNFPVIGSPDLNRCVIPLHGYASTVTATQVNLPELQKISKDYSYAYRIKTSRVYYLSPGHIKVDSSVGPVAALYVINGNEKTVKYGPFRKRMDVSQAPGKKESLMDFGLITKDALEDYTWKYLRSQRDGGGSLDVYELLYKNPKDSSRFLIWVDPVHRVITRRQVFHQLPDRSLKLDLRFEGLTKVGNLWIPSVVKVYNSEGRLGAVSRQSGIRIDRGLPPATFKL